MKLEQSFHKQYLEHFFHRTSAEIETYPEFSRQLTKDIIQGFDALIPQIFLLTGARGCGRKKLISRITHSIQVERLNFIDCGLFSTENRLWERIYKDFIKNEEDEKQSETIPNDQRLNHLFNQFLEDKKVVLYLDNIQLFCEKRQTFLYSFLDNISLVGSNLCLIFSTTDLFFHEKLEKRVKSRFNFISYLFNFKHTCPYKFVLDFASENKKLPHLQVFSEWLRSPKCKALIMKLSEFCFDLGAFIRLIHCALCYFPTNVFNNALEHPHNSISINIENNKNDFKTGVAFFEECLTLAYKSLFAFNRLLIIQRLPRLHQVILKTLVVEFDTSNNMSYILVKNIISKLIANKPGHKFSQEAIFFGIEDLIAHDMIAVPDNIVTTSSKVILKCDTDESRFIRDNF